tara:strand:- start:375 stop:1100 length:726 start_codon:yes stop_codon:yes gene_type:complete
MNSKILKIKAKKFSSNKKINDHLNEFGWVNLKGLIPKNIIKKIYIDFNNLSQKMCGLNFKDAVIYLNKHNKNKLHRLSLDVAKTPNHMKLNEIFNKKYIEILNKKVLLVNFGQFVIPAHPSDKRLAYKFHQENNYYPHYDHTIHFHFALFDKATLKNGAMSALSKSHEMNRITDYKIIKQKKGVTSIVPKNIKEFSKKYDETLFELDIGDLLIFDGNLIHKSNYNKTKKARIVGIHRSAVL